MTRHAYRYVLLGGVMLGLLGLGSSASAASRWASSFPFTKTTLTHAGVERLLAHGERLRLTSTFAEETQVRLFVYARALNRGGQRPVQPANEKVYISHDTDVISDHPGARWVTLHVNGLYRAALLRAGTIIEGYYYAGYELLHNSAPSRPTAKTTSASGVSDSAATLNGVIATGGAAVKEEFYWGVNAGDLKHTTPLRTIPAGSGTVSVQAETSSTLTPDKKYYFLLVVFYRNPGSRSFSRYTTGGFKSFTTKPQH